MDNKPTLNCSTSTDAAFYLEWQRILGVDFASENKVDQARRLRMDYHDWAMALPELKAINGGNHARAIVYALSNYVDVILKDGSDCALTDPRNMRRGDVAQIWWGGHASSPEGHSVFIHDVLVQSGGEVWFQVLSAQGNDPKVWGGTTGVGIAGSGLAIYDATPSTQGTLLQAGRWMHQITGWKAGDRVPSRYTTVPEIFVGRFYRPFPVWPGALPGQDPKRQQISYITDMGAEGTLLAEDVQMTTAIDYIRNCEARADGFYPIGASRAWHGGIHLSLAADAPVRAISDGVIVAARCARVDHELENARDGRKGAEGSAQLPSRAFVLIRHQVLIGGAEKVFFSLYMHLDGSLADGSDKLLAARWLWQARQLAQGAKQKSSSLAGYDGKVAAALDQGDVVLFAYPVASGDVIGFAKGDYLHLEIFSENDLSDADYPLKQLIDDSAPENFHESSAIIGQLESATRMQSLVSTQLPHPDNAVLMREEISEFFAHACDQQRARVRGLVTRHVSEWSRKLNWQDINILKAWAYYDKDAVDTLLKVAELYSWMSDEVAKACKLPANHIVHHYHPAVFIDWLACKASTGAAKPMIQDVVSFLKNAGEDFTPHGELHPMPKWYLNPECTDAWGQMLTALATYTGTKDRPDLKSRPILAGQGVGPLLPDTGPWVQHGDPYVEGGSTFIRTQDDPPNWICVAHGPVAYATSDT
jgi:hypothetical protein